eukprot:2496375-Alexandrium_andersonii.AAC.1
MSRVAQPRELRLVGWRGDPPDVLEVRAYADADLASDRNAGRGATGGVVQVVGPDTRFVLSAVSKKQTAASRSTPGRK